jgi:hypothetical protein
MPLVVVAFWSYIALITGLLGFAAVTHVIDFDFVTVPPSLAVPVISIFKLKLTP